MVDVNAAALGWKHNHEPGIQTLDGVLTEWPSSLGAFPTQTQADTWETEYLAAVPDIEARAEIDKDKLIRLLFEITFDQENRLRVLEAAPRITKARYKNALVSTYKTLP